MMLTLCEACDNMLFMISFLWMRELKQEGLCNGKTLTAGKWQSQDPNPGSLSPESPAAAGQVLPVLSMPRATFRCPTEINMVIGCGRNANQRTRTHQWQSIPIDSLKFTKLQRERFQESRKEELIVTLFKVTLKILLGCD